jgi:hypothetical protein
MYAMYTVFSVIKMAITNVRTARKNAKNLRRKMNENN